MIRAAVTRWMHRRQARQTAKALRVCQYTPIADECRIGIVDSWWLGLLYFGKR